MINILSLLVTVLLAHYAYIVQDITLSLIAAVIASLMLLGNIISILKNKG